MTEYRKHFIGEATKGLTAAIVGALLVFVAQTWLTSDLEFRKASRDAYLSASLGQQGLTMAFDGKALKNVSVVEFAIFNRTGKQFAVAELLFTIDDPDSSATLVSGGIISPRGMSSAEMVEELPSKDPKARKFSIKPLPKQMGSDYFHAVFVFNGEKSPSMSVTSAGGDLSIGPYQEWKDGVVPLALMLGIAFVLALALWVLSSLIDYFSNPRVHKKQVERFAERASELQKRGELQSTDGKSLVDAAAIYASFTRPKPSKFWSKVLPAQRFEY